MVFNSSNLLYMLVLWKQS